MKTIDAKQKNLKKYDLVQLKTLADALVSTLGSMPAEEADRTVAKVANVIYQDILDLKGKIVEVSQGFVEYKDGSGSHHWTYKFIEE